MSQYSIDELFVLKFAMEAQLERDFVDGPSAEEDGSFDFLIGEWDLTRTNFDARGACKETTFGTVSAHYTLGGRAIQEDFFNHRKESAQYRGGSALYTYRASSSSWHVAAIDAAIGATSYQPDFVDGEVRYESEVQLPAQTVFTRSRIFNISEATTEWEQQVSVDGTNWLPNYHIRNVRRA